MRLKFSHWDGAHNNQAHKPQRIDYQITKSTSQSEWVTTGAQPPLVL